MRIILASLALAIITVVAPAPADAADCYTVAALPDTCLTLETRDYIVAVEAQRDQALVNYANARELIGVLRQEHNATLAALWESGLARQAAERDASIARADRDVALDAVTFFKTRNAVLRATVRHLRHLLEGVI